MKKYDTQEILDDEFRRMKHAKNLDKENKTNRHGKKQYKQILKQRKIRKKAYLQQLAKDKGFIYAYKGDIIFVLILILIIIIAIV